MNYIKHIQKLKQKKYRKEAREFLVEGIKGVEEALNSRLEVLLVVVEGKRRDEEGIKEIVQLANTKSVQIEFVGRKDIGGIKDADTFPGILAVVEMPEIDLGDFGDGPIVCLDQVNDPGNLGTIIRTCDWFGVKNIILSKGSVDPYNEKTVRSTMGSIFRANIYLSTNIVHDLEHLKNQGYKIATLDLDGENINDARIEEKTILLFGSESHGVSKDLKNMSDKVYTIPGKGQAESLNLGVSVGVVLSKII